MTPKIETLKEGGRISADAVLWLTSKQASAREHQLVEVGGGVIADRRAYRVLAPVYFKAGEEIAAETVGDRSFDVLVGRKSEPVPAAVQPTPPAPPKAAKASRKQLDAARAEGHKAGFEAGRVEGVKAGRAEMLAEVERRNALFEAVEAAEIALVNAKGDDATAKAQQALDDAEAAVAGLPELVA